MNDLTANELEVLISVFRMADVHPDDDNPKGQMYSRLLEAKSLRDEMDAFASDCGDACKL